MESDAIIYGGMYENKVVPELPDFTKPSTFIDKDKRFGIVQHDLGNEQFPERTLFSLKVPAAYMAQAMQQWRGFHPDSLHYYADAIHYLKSIWIINRDAEKERGNCFLSEEILMKIRFDQNDGGNCIQIAAGGGNQPVQIPLIHSMHDFPPGHDVDSIIEITANAIKEVGLKVMAEKCQREAMTIRFKCKSPAEVAHESQTSEAAEPQDPPIPEADLPQ